MSESLADDPELRKGKAGSPGQRVSAHEMERLKRITRMLDSRFRIPGTPIRFGFDGLIGLIPGVGDVLTALPILYYLNVARRTGASRMLQFRMLGNGLIDLSIGGIPVVGDLFDFAFKSHRRNYELLMAHLGEPAGD